MRLNLDSLIVVGPLDPHGRFSQSCNRGIRPGSPDQIPSRRNYVPQLLYSQRIVSRRGPGIGALSPVQNPRSLPCNNILRSDRRLRENRGRHPPG